MSLVRAVREADNFVRSEIILVGELSCLERLYEHSKCPSESMRHTNRIGNL